MSSRARGGIIFPNVDEVLLSLLYAGRELLWPAERHGAFCSGYWPLFLAVFHIGYSSSCCREGRTRPDGYSEVLAGFTFRVYLLRGTQLAQGTFLSLSAIRRVTDLGYQLIRPEFQPFIENEQSIINLVKDVATVLAEIAVNSHHTPALYSAFLRALISARTDAPAQEPEDMQPGDRGDNMNHGDMTNNNNDNNINNSALFAGNPHMGMNGRNGMSDYSFASEMGPVADISTFPPTMADMPSSDEHMGMLSMENILSNGFWDSVLVPGKQLIKRTCFCLFDVSFRLLGYYGRPEWRIRVWGWRQRAYHSWLGFPPTIRREHTNAKHGLQPPKFSLRFPPAKRLIDGRSSMCFASCHMFFLVFCYRSTEIYLPCDPVILTMVFLLCVCTFCSTTFHQCTLFAIHLAVILLSLCNNIM